MATVSNPGEGEDILRRCQRDLARASSGVVLLSLGFWEVLQTAGMHVCKNLPLQHRQDKAQRQSSGGRGGRPRICVVTGGNAGLGEALAASLVAQGDRVIIACRSLERGRAAAARITAHAALPAEAPVSVSVLALDLGSLRSVEDFAQQLAQQEPQGVDVLVNNAGIMAPPLQEVTADGLESQWQVNYLSHFLLTRRVLALRSSTKASTLRPLRVVNLSSMTHAGGQIDFQDLNSEQSYRPFAAYAQSKLAIVASTREWQRRHSPEELVAVSVHPGLVDTALARTFFLQRTPPPLQPALQVLFPIFLKTTEEAVDTLLAAVNGDADKIAGQYISDGRVHKGSRQSRDVQLSKRLWAVSCDQLRILGCSL